MWNIFSFLLILKLVSSQTSRVPIFTSDLNHVGTGQYATIFDRNYNWVTGDDDLVRKQMRAYAVSIIGSNSDTTTYEMFRTAYLPGYDQSEADYTWTSIIGPTTFKLTQTSFAGQDDWTFFDHTEYLSCSYSVTKAACTVHDVAVGTNAPQGTPFTYSSTVTSILLGTYEIVTKRATITASVPSSTQAISSSTTASTTPVISHYTTSPTRPQATGSNPAPTALATIQPFISTAGMRNRWDGSLAFLSTVLIGSLLCL